MERSRTKTRSPGGKRTRSCMKPDGATFTRVRRIGLCLSAQRSTTGIEITRKAERRQIRTPPAARRYSMHAACYVLHESFRRGVGALANLERTSLLSASIAQNVHTSPLLGSSTGFTCFSFLPMKPQISSISRRVLFGFRKVSLIMAVQPWPTRTPRRITVSR